MNLTVCATPRRPVSASLRRGLSAAAACGIITCGPAPAGAALQLTGEDVAYAELSGGGDRRVPGLCAPLRDQPAPPGDAGWFSLENLFHQSGRVLSHRRDRRPGPAAPCAGPPAGAVLEGGCVRRLHHLLLFRSGDRQPAAERQRPGRELQHLLRHLIFSLALL